MLLKPNFSSKIFYFAKKHWKCTLGFYFSFKLGFFFLNTDTKKKKKKVEDLFSKDL